MIFRKERQVKILPAGRPVFCSVSSSQIFPFDVFSDLSAFIDGSADAFITKVSLSSKGISIWVFFPYSFFQVILPSLLTPFPVRVSTANLNYKTETGWRDYQTSRWEMWKIFRNIHQALLLVIIT